MIIPKRLWGDTYSKWKAKSKRYSNAQTRRTRIKYAKLILAAIIADGKRWGYIK